MFTPTERSYNRIYWITAIDQASLLSGYQKIAKTTGLKYFSDLNPVETAEAVLSWLSQERNWLLVIDNLDDINVVSRNNLDDVNVVQKFLPPTGPHQHTLITTRNPHAVGIPAEGMEVPLLDREESIDLLSTLSKITIIPDSPESEQANQIVEELGHLPLGIEQAAAYVREAAGDFQTFLKRYEENRRDLHRWLPQGIRPYSYSIATTWSMSFNIVRKNNPQAAELFRLLSFLNPDNILIDFLQSGAAVFENDLRQVILNQINMDNALIELEKFSLLKWNRLTRTLLIHRLVQMVIKDEMSDADSMTLRITIINLCDQSFPQKWTNENRALCRICIDQIMGPLLDLKVIRTEKSANVMYRVGWFLRDDGKISDSERLSLQAVEIYTKLTTSFMTANDTPPGVLERARILGAKHATHEQPRGDVPGSGEDGGRGQASRGGAGEEQADPGRRSSRHAYDHEQPRGDVPGSGEDGGRGQASRGGAGEEAGGSWATIIPTRLRP